MIRDIDLDIKNYQEKECDPETEVLFYFRGDLNDESFTYAIVGDVAEIVAYLSDIKESRDIVLSAAAVICKTQDIDFNEVLNEVKLEE